MTSTAIQSVAVGKSFCLNIRARALLNIVLGRLEPVGVLVFSVIMVTSFVQVGIQCVQRLAGPEHEIISLGLPAIIIMVSTIVIKGACWVWCRLVRNSSVRAL